MALNPKRKMQQHSFGERLQIVQKLNDGATVAQLAAEYRVNKRTIYRYRKNAASLRQISERLNSMDFKKRPTVQYKDVDTRLHTWILERRALGDKITDSIMQEKAKELHEEFGGTSNFAASRGWLQSFKRRHGIGRRGIRKKGSEANESSTNRRTDELAGILFQKDVYEENVYNMTETNLMWRVLPERILADEERLTEDKRIKTERVTVAFCANITGTHKLPLLFINKYPNPRALKHCRHILPVVYKSQYNAWMDEDIFNDWYTNHFMPTVWQHQAQGRRMGKVILLVDSGWEDVLSQQTEDDSQVKIIFLPPNRTSIVQSSDRGVIAECKQLFRYKLLHRVFQYYGGVRQFYADYDIKDCIDLISESWNEVTAANIKSSWGKLLSQPSTTESFEEQDFKVNIQQRSEQFTVSIPFEEIKEWISECEQAESAASEEDDPIDGPRCGIEEEEIDHTFSNLAVWAEIEPKVINVHTQFLIDYYNQK